MGLIFDYNYANALIGDLPETPELAPAVFEVLPHQTKEYLQPLLNKAEEWRTSYQDILVIGIGGSDLGTRAVHRALNHQFYNYHHSVRNDAPRIFFMGDTTDPVAIQEVLEVIEPAKTGIIVVSKSGSTVESLSVFMYVADYLSQKIGWESTWQRVMAITDPDHGTLRELVHKKSLQSLPIPPGVGGRFSVLSVAALFPLAVAGVDILELLRGAREPSKDEAYKYAYCQFKAYQEGKNISVMMPYSYSLQEVGRWFRQLWAESLGKNGCGPTPIAAVGPTDQHSQLQLYMQGPPDKIFTFIAVDEERNKKVPKLDFELEATDYLIEKRFMDILNAEQQSTAQALNKVERPSITLRLEKRDAYHLGQLLYFFEMSTVYMASLLKVNAFDQPGVELSKKYLYSHLGRSGYTE